MIENFTFLGFRLGERKLNEMEILLNLYQDKLEQLKLDLEKLQKEFDFTNEETIHDLLFMELQSLGITYSQEQNIIGKASYWNKNLEELRVISCRSFIKDTCPIIFDLISGLDISDIVVMFGKEENLF
jgi:hypothetical protein